MKHKYISMILLLLLLFSNGFAGSDGQALVIIQNYKFIPPVITIKKGQTLVWENREKRQYHSVWFEELGEEESDYLFPEEIYQRRFDEVGTYPYRCGPHPEMTATVIVVD